MSICVSHSCPPPWRAPNELASRLNKEVIVDIAIAARGGMETLRPALQRLYVTTASACRDALKSFLEGYQEGIQQIMEEKEDSSKAQQEGCTDKNST
ncbi:hypothetical protein ERO13_D02G000150v2 [Gossypium hirsutum]|uniref:Uncharacterized protein n=2 Tax=Gossypium TaxID=3633 RepID=A0A5J5S6Y4_GOSBA|nr:hypothetical protein ES319_D02G000400v1 [Gossypium barbadense]KAG4156492.1 hypothetical protein ERO13_D02G000150v2 [Gossypium hirsutum]TYI91542.1 hypothetical protein E1A91_D02G000600v1 [Gossypium mustelinum]